MSAPVWIRGNRRLPYQAPKPSRRVVWDLCPDGVVRGFIRMTLT